MINKPRIMATRILLKRFAPSIQLKIFGVIGINCLLFRKWLTQFVHFYRDVFFDGNEKIVIRTDARNPDESPKKYKVLFELWV